MYAQEPLSPGADSHVKRGRFSVTARYSTSACRSCSRDRADSARVRSRSARPHIRPAVTATSVVSRSASAKSPPDASVANHVTAVTPAPIKSAIRAARMRRSGDRAGPDTGDVREPSSAVAMSQGDSVNSNSWELPTCGNRSSKGRYFAQKGRFPLAEGRRSRRHDSAPLSDQGPARWRRAERSPPPTQAATTENSS